MTDNESTERPAGRHFPLWAVAATVLVLQALLGVVAGVVMDRYVFLRHHRHAFLRYHGAPPAMMGPGGMGYRHPPGADGGDWEFGMRRRMVDRLSQELALSASQRERLDSLMERRAASFRRVREEMQPRLKALIDSSRAEIEGLLTPEQRERFRQLRAREKPGFEDHMR